MGCVWAGYFERYGRHAVSVLKALIVGVFFTALDVGLAGVWAAMAWPRWFVSFAKVHKHLALELSGVVEFVIPGAFLAAGCGFLLARIVPVRSLALPCVSFAVWVAYLLWPVADVPFTMVLSSYVRDWPATFLVVVLPLASFLFAFRRTELRSLSSDG
jgi:hypothetical protein